MTPMSPPNPPSGNDKVKRIIFGVLGIIMAAYLLSHAVSGFKDRQKALGPPDPPSSSAPP